LAATRQITLDNRRSKTMSNTNDSDRYVVPNTERGGWDVVKEDHERASAHTRTQAEAIDRAREIVDNLGGGEVRIARRDGSFRDSDTQSGPHHQESPTRDKR
jgi:hypothetical protein